MANLPSAPPALTSAAHPHRLTLVRTGGPVFQCRGCQQPGADKDRYRCDPCNFDLHVPCALPTPQSTIVHPHFGGCTFTFFTGLPSPGASNSRNCDACGDHVLGFVYHSQGGLDLHPCCAFLKESIVYNGREFHLCNQAAGACHLCGQDQNGPRGKFWTYASCHDAVNMHVACMLYGGLNCQSGPASTELSRSISATPSPFQTAITPTQVVTPGSGPSQVTTTAVNVIATAQTINTLYSFGKMVKDIAAAFNTEDSTDTAGLLE